MIALKCSVLTTDMLPFALLETRISHLSTQVNKPRQVVQTQVAFFGMISRVDSAYAGEYKSLACSHFAPSRWPMQHLAGPSQADIIGGLCLPTSL